MGRRSGSHAAPRRAAPRRAPRRRDRVEMVGIGAAVVIALSSATAAAIVLTGDEGTEEPASRTGTLSVATDEEAATVPGRGNGAWDPYALPDDGEPDGAAASGDARERWEQVATSFATRLLDDAGPWVAELRQLSTPQLTARLRTTDPGLVPAGEPGDVALVRAGDNAVEASVEVASREGAWTLTLHLVNLPGDGDPWRVYAFDEQEASA